MDPRKHVGWLRDQSHDFLDNPFDSLQPGQKTTIFVELNQSLCGTNVAAYFTGYGKVTQVGALVAYVVVEDVRQEDLSQLAAEPFVAAVEEPRELKWY